MKNEKLTIFQEIRITYERNKYKWKRFFCQVFGHKFVYYDRSGELHKRIRVCVRCHEAFYHTVNPMKYYKNGKENVWMNMVRYTSHGAKKMVESIKDTTEN